MLIGSFYYSFCAQRKCGECSESSFEYRSLGKGTGLDLLLVLEDIGCCALSVAGDLSTLCFYGE